MWTLNNALQECARNTYNTKTMLRTGVSYSGKGLEYATRFLSGINYAINKVCRERLGVVYSQDVVLDDKGRFNISVLTNACLKVIGVSLGGDPYIYSVNVDEVVTVDGVRGETVKVTYEAIPPDLTMSDLDKPLPIDQRYVDPRVLCQYANYQFLSEEGTEYDSARAQVWLGLFNDSFGSIFATNRMPRRVRYNG
jgi:hypothetical protein